MGASCSSRRRNALYLGPTETLTTTLTKENTTKGKQLGMVGSYKVGRRLGQGAYGAVHLCTKEYGQYAMKVIDLTALSKKGAIGARRNQALCAQRQSNPHQRSVRAVGRVSLLRLRVHGAPSAAERRSTTRSMC